MVGKYSLSVLRQRLHQVASNDSGEDYRPPVTRNTIHPDAGGRHVPFIASPLDPKTTQWLKTKHLHSNLTLKRRPTVAQQEASRVSAGGIFRKQKEASPLELFFDLFFVANLAVFTYNHTQTTGGSVGNYIGFFSILWTFWFHISIHDVRFYVDSILNRFFKLTQFIMFTSFSALGAVYGVLEEGGVTRAFHGLEIVLMLSRLILVVQYGVILWYVRPFKKTLVPLALMMLIYLCSAMAFLGVYAEDAGTKLTTQQEGHHHVVVWYVVVVVEALAVISVSSIWRILSFKYTHLVERVGLLTLIIMGEGVIGVVKSIAYILDGTVLSIWDATGRIIGNVFLIYLVFVIYFTPISHDRFGTIRQQFWVLLHFPLHVAIVLTEEGSASTLLWMTIINARGRLVNNLPDFYEPSKGLTTLTDFITKVNTTMTDTANTYTYVKLKDVYDWSTDLGRFRNISSIYATERWNDQAHDILSDMINETSIFFFENFKFETSKKTAAITDPNLKLEAYYLSMQVIFTFFYVCAGSICLVLGAMFWLGKNNKTWEEYISIAARLVVGIALPLITIAAYTQPFNTGYMFYDAGWIVSVAVFCYLFVVIIDNVVQGIYDKRYLRRIASGEVSGEDLEDLHKRRFNGAFGPHAPDESISGETTIKEGKSESPSRKIRFQERSTMGSLANTNSHTRSGSTGEGDSLFSSDHTLSGHRDSEQVIHDKTSPSPPGTHTIPRKKLRSTDYQTHQPQDQPTYYLPPIGRNNSGYGRIDTEYRGMDGLGSSDMDEERHHGTTTVRNDHSFDEETMMSPISSVDDRIRRPENGHIGRAR